MRSSNFLSFPSVSRFPRVSTQRIHKTGYYKRIIFCSWTFAATKFDEIFWGYQPRQVSVCNWHFEDHLGHHHHHQQQQQQQPDFCVFKINKTIQKFSPVYCNIHILADGGTDFAAFGIWFFGRQWFQSTPAWSFSGTFRTSQQINLSLLSLCMTHWREVTRNWSWSIVKQCTDFHLKGLK